jgi:hypothetical protein
VRAGFTQGILDVVMVSRGSPTPFSEASPTTGRSSSTGSSLDPLGSIDPDRPARGIEDSTAPIVAPPMGAPPIVAQSLKAPQKPRKPVKPNIIEEINKTVPTGFELHRSSRFQVGSTFEVVMLKIHVPPHLEPKLKEWRQGLEDRFPLTSIFIRRVAVDQNLSNHLRSQFRQQEIISDEARPQLSHMIDHLCGRPPPAALQPRSIIPFRENFQEIPFIAIDRPEVQNREDLIYGERKQDGTLVLKVAIIDITDYILPGSEQDRYALRVGNDYYGRTRSISTIGTTLSRGKGSFTLGEVRPAWVAEMRISPKDGVITRSFKLRRAWVRNHANVNPEEPFDVKAQPELAPIIASLADITRLLEQQRISKSKMISIDAEGTTNRIVAETMIAANEQISEYIENKLKIPAGYIVHQQPTPEDHQSWLSALHELGIPASIEDFKDPWNTLGILRSLEEHNSPLARSLENNILDISMVRSVVSSRKTKHVGLRLNGYTRLKPREALGILNQLALDAAFVGLPGVTGEEIDRRLRTINDNRWKRDEKHYKLRFLEMLEEKLALVGHLFLAEVSHIDAQVVFEKDGLPLSPQPETPETPSAEVIAAWERHLKRSRVNPGPGDSAPPPLPEGVTAKLVHGNVHVQVEGFSKWGIIKDTKELDLKPGDPVAVVLKGFNLKSARFEFELTTL